ncbi:AzlC family ABC transporter permease [Cohaesibacter celericrescens]|uniref:Branched-chain amino acid ABC transporter permease n=1 Tax=Cohaesibacter celericrescens TaxID=2067669 RepID=A0A2N5XQG9_9HYPH|nr:AzlC family ABC transporter permease [Cohaesibacter celericrescens]PLW76743.1 branched-chain amino acid ABC transporter permease [Cohaesibacter celericrescens]
MTSKRLPDDSMTTGTLFLEGAKRCLPVILAASPFGALFGALAVEAGMTVSEAVIMSASIFAGASQLVGLELFGQAIPAWVVVMSIFAVNFRHILYSASLGRHISHWPILQQAFGFFFLIDPVYAEAERRHERGFEVQFAWYLGLVIPIYIGWIALTWLGAILGNFLNDAQKWGIDFILPIYFMGLVLGFRKRSFWLPVVAVSAVASIIASKTVGSPWHVSIGAMAGILFAAVFAPNAKGQPPAEVSVSNEGAV